MFGVWFMLFYPFNTKIKFMNINFIFDKNKIKFMNLFML